MGDIPEEDLLAFPFLCPRTSAHLVGASTTPTLRGSPYRPCPLPYSSLSLLAGGLLRDHSPVLVLCAWILAIGFRNPFAANWPSCSLCCDHSTKRNRNLLFSSSYACDRSCSDGILPFCYSIARALRALHISAHVLRCLTIVEYYPCHSIVLQ